jgi:hypothetical protein
MQSDLSARHVGEDEALDIHVFRGDQVIGMGEVKSDVDPSVASAREAQAKYDAYVIDLPPDTGEWSVTLRYEANMKDLGEQVGAVICVASELGFTFVSPEQLWQDEHAVLLKRIQQLAIANFWRQEGSSYNRAIVFHEPWGGLVPDVCPDLQEWISGVLSSFASKQSLEILSSSLDLEQRHFVICIDSKSPVEIQLYAMHHALKYPSQKLELPAWVTDLWVVLPRAFQPGDIAWRYSSSGNWDLFASDGFLEF